MERINPIELQKSLKNIRYPASKHELINQAKENGASEKIQHVLEKLTAKDYNTPTEVNHEVKEIC